MNSAMIVYENFDTMQRAAMALARSGYFVDAKDEAQAIVKVMAGAELGLPPFASMTGIHIIKGKPTLGANVIATLVKNHPNYNYKVLELTESVCKIQFFEGGEPCGISEFTAQDARKAGTQNMDKFPKNMLFARAISNGARWYCPAIFGGSPVYTPDEMGAAVDEDGYVVGQLEPVAQAAQSALAAANGSAPPPTDWRAEALRAKGVSGWATAAYQLPGTANALEDAAATQRWYEHVIGAFNPQTNAAALGALDRYVSAVADGAKKPLAIEKARRVYAADTASAAAEDGSMSRRDVAPLFEEAGPDVGDGDNMPMSG